MVKQVSKAINQSMDQNNDSEIENANIHLLSESCIWESTSEFTDINGNISKGKGISDIKVFNDKITNNSFAEFDGKRIYNDYEIHQESKTILHSRSTNPALGIQKGTFHVNGSKLFFDFTIENSSLRGFEIIRREGNICFSDGALYNGEELINTWSAILRKKE